jgi:hypothetical protein
LLIHKEEHQGISKTVITAWNMLKKSHTGAEFKCIHFTEDLTGVLVAMRKNQSRAL